MESILATFILACSSFQFSPMGSAGAFNKDQAECIQRVSKCIVEADYAPNVYDKTKYIKCAKEVHL